MEKKLQVGDKYLSIKLAGHNPVAAFKNLDKKRPEEPDYKGNGVAVWISKKKAPEAKEANTKVQYEDLED